MRSTDKQLAEIMTRSEIIKKERMQKKRLSMSAFASCACIVLLIMVALNLPDFTVASLTHAAQQYGSLLLAAPYMGYVMVGILAFALGICVTLLCVYWKKLKQKERE